MLLGCGWVDPPVVGAVLGHDAQAERHLWLFRQQDDGRFLRDPVPFGHSLSSLGLAAVDDSLILTGLGFWPGSNSQWRRDWLGPPVHGLQTRDLDRWEPLLWRLKGDPGDRVPIDPQLLANEDGLELYYYAVPPAERGDPGLRSGARIIARAGLDGEARWTQDVLEVPSVADPSPVTFQGQRLLFATTQPGNEITLFAGDPLSAIRTWTGVSVPSAFVHDGVLELWASRWSGHQQQAVRALSRDGRTFSNWEQPLPMTGVRHCASPAGASFHGQVVVVCADELPMAPGKPPPGG